MSDETTESRLNKLEIEISFYKGAAIVGFLAILCFFGVQSILLIPNAANQAMEKEVTEKSRNLLRQAITMSEQITNDRSTLYKLHVSGAAGRIKEEIIGPYALCAISELRFNYSPSGGESLICEVIPIEESPRMWRIHAESIKDQTVTCAVQCL